jgi:hypothetical protein
VREHGKTKSNLILDEIDRRWVELITSR